MRQSRLLLVAAFAVVISSTGIVLGGAPASEDPPTQLRWGVIGAVNFNIAFVDPATGEIRGVGADLIRAFAAQVGASLDPVVYPTNQAILAALNEDAWDIYAEAGGAARAAGALYAGSYMLVEQTYLVAEDSPFTSTADLDRPGVRIVVNRGAPGDLQLTGLLRQAELVRSDAPGIQASESLFAGEVDAYAFNRQELLRLVEQRPGFRVLEDSFAVTDLGIALSPGHETLLAQVREFLEDAKASGLVQEAIEANGVRGVRVAEPGQ